MRMEKMQAALSVGRWLTYICRSKRKESSDYWNRMRVSGYLGQERRQKMWWEDQRICFRGTPSVNPTTTQEVGTICNSFYSWEYWGINILSGFAILASRTARTISPGSVFSITRTVALKLPANRYQWGGLRIPTPRLKSRIHKWGSVEEEFLWNSPDDYSVQRGLQTTDQDMNRGTLQDKPMQLTTRPFGLSRKLSENTQARNREGPGSQASWFPDPHFSPLKDTLGAVAKRKEQ